MRGEDGAPRLVVPVDPGRDHIRGDPAAPVTLLEYGDFECPFCARAHAIVEEALARTGDRVRFVFRHFPLRTAHPHAMSAAVAAECAASQDAFWPMHDRIFDGQDALEDDDLIAYADELGLDVARFASELESVVHEARVRADFLGGVRSGVNGTPTLFIDGRRHDGSWDLEPLVAALEGRDHPRRRRAG